METLDGAGSPLVRALAPARAPARWDRSALILARPASIPPWPPPDPSALPAAAAALLDWLKFLPNGSSSQLSKLEHNQAVGSRRGCVCGIFDATNTTVARRQKARRTRRLTLPWGEKPRLPSTRVA